MNTFHLASLTQQYLLLLSKPFFNKNQCSYSYLTRVKTSHFLFSFRSQRRSKFAKEVDPSRLGVRSKVAHGLRDVLVRPVQAQVELVVGVDKVRLDVLLEIIERYVLDVDLAAHRAHLVQRVRLDLLLQNVDVLERRGLRFRCRRLDRSGGLWHFRQGKIFRTGFGCCQVLCGKVVTHFHSFIHHLGFGISFSVPAGLAGFLLKLQFP
uniref:(northern house mosquito) hypothetical protein n=1 Tax=Culex pipiens TaxID=7175 RepID=A0A8D8FNP0_CULPI